MRRIEVTPQAPPPPRPGQVIQATETAEFDEDWGEIKRRRQAATQPEYDAGVARWNAWYAAWIAKEESV